MPPIGFWKATMRVNMGGTSYRYLGSNSLYLILAIQKCPRKCRVTAAEAILVSLTSPSSWKLANKPSMFTHKEKWNVLALLARVQLWVCFPQTGTITCIFTARDGATAGPMVCDCICVQFCLWPKSTLTRDSVSSRYPAASFTFPICSLYLHNVKYISPPPSRQIKEMEIHYSGFQQQLESREWGQIHFLFPK